MPRQSAPRRRPSAAAGRHGAATVLALGSAALVAAPALAEDAAPVPSRTAVVGTTPSANPAPGAGASAIPSATSDDGTASPVLPPSAEPTPGPSATGSPETPQPSPSSDDSPSPEPTPSASPSSSSAAPQPSAPPSDSSDAGGNGSAGNGARDHGTGGSAAVVPQAPSNALPGTADGTVGSGRNGQTGAGGQPSAAPQSPGTGGLPRREGLGVGGDASPNTYGGARPADGIGRPSLNGVSGWIKSYLDSSRGGNAPTIDSNDNAGVQKVRAADGDAAGDLTSGRTRTSPAALRGPLPLMLFSAVALGGVLFAIARASRSQRRRNQ